MDILQNLDSHFSAIILVIGAIFILIANTLVRNFSRNMNVALCLLFICISFATLFAHSINIAHHVKIAQAIILIASFSFIFLAISKNRYDEFQTPEFYSLYLFAIAGFCLMVNTTNLVLMLLGLEVGSLPLVAMMSFNIKRGAIESAIKFFIMSVFASIFFIVGIALFYSATNSLDLIMPDLWHQTLLNSFVYPDISKILMLSIALLFMIAGIGFKISLVPWHTWMPDTYEGSNALLAGYISIVPKIAGFVMFANIYLNTNWFLGALSQVISVTIDDIIRILIIITITLPNIMALIQKDVKRMLAYSSISHSGFGLSCIYFISLDKDLYAYDVLFLYWILFFIANVGAFGLLWLMHNKENIWHSRFEYPFEKFQGLVRLNPLLSISLAIFMISLAGVPPFSIFWGKIMIIMSAIKHNDIWLSVIMMLNSAIAVYYYLKLIVFMFFKKPLTQDSQLRLENDSYAINLVIIISLILCVGSMFMLSLFEKTGILLFAH